MAKKFILTFFICLLFSSAVFANSYDSLEKVTEYKLPSGVSIAIKSYDSRDKITRITGIAPNITGDQNLKNRMETIIASKIGKAVSGNLSSVSFDYKIVVCEEQNTLSLLLKSTSSTSSVDEEISSLVFDMDTNEILNISHFLGRNSSKIAANVVNAYIVKNYRYMPKIDGLENNADFYVKDDRIELLFDKYEIAPGSEGIKAVPLNLSNLHTLIISKEEYIDSKEKNNVRLLPLRRIAEYFGYFVYWNGETGEITISSHSTLSQNNKDDVLIKTNQNFYKYQGDLSAQVLEAAPEIVDGSAYVPLSFFESFVNIYYSTRADGSIELSAYKK